MPANRPARPAPSGRSGPAPKQSAPAPARPLREDGLRPDDGRRAATWPPGESKGRDTPRAAARRPQGFATGPHAGTRDRESRQVLDHLQRRGHDIWEIWRRLSALQKDLQAILPSVRLQPLKLEKQVLVVTAASSAMAARLRQYEPRLLDGLQARGWLVTRIRFRPNTVHVPPPPPPVEKAPVPERALAAMTALASAEGTSPALREALQRFVRRQRSYRN